MIFPCPIAQRGLFGARCSWGGAEEEDYNMVCKSATTRLQEHISLKQGKFLVG
eukprot:m.21165 g.21165  ORF g.21165 m.21165 type:complete len:53 (-) comp7054_c0_seq2:1683-1841(-)